MTDEQHEGNLCWQAEVLSHRCTIARGVELIEIYAGRSDMYVGRVDPVMEHKIVANETAVDVDQTSTAEQSLFDVHAQFTSGVDNRGERVLDSTDDPAALASRYPAAPLSEVDTGEVNDVTDRRD